MWSFSPAIFWQLERSFAVAMGTTQTVHYGRNTGSDPLDLVSSLGRVAHSFSCLPVGNACDAAGMPSLNNDDFRSFNVGGCSACSDRITDSHYR